jgi:hypothetical protein
MLIQTMTLTWLMSTAAPPPQTYHYRAPQARRHFISVSYDWQYTHPMGFRTHPLEDLLGRPVDEVHLETFNYRTADGQTLIRVPQFDKQGQGVGVTLYPFGASQGATLAIRGSIEQLPAIRVTFEGPSPVASYTLTNGRSFDIGVGVDMSDRAPGWGIGSHAFVLGGIGRTHADELDGSRYFGEAGGGVTSGPIGVDFSVKFAVNRFSEPVSHRFLTIPVSVRGTLTF